MVSSEKSFILTGQGITLTLVLFLTLYKDDKLPKSLYRFLSRLQVQTETFIVVGTDHLNELIDERGPK